ncbi:hypothetical protein ACOME3_005217 [Neoechinorhynchus agilis]
MPHSRKSSTRSHDDESDLGNSNQWFEGNSSETNTESIAPVQKKCRRINPWGPYTYADLITNAIISSPDKKLTLREIYSWLEENIPYFRDHTGIVESRRWKNAVRHNLTQHKKFFKIEQYNNPKKSLWTIIPNCVEPESQRPYRKRENSSSMTESQNERTRFSNLTRGQDSATHQEFNRTAENINASYLGQGFWNNSTNIGNPNQPLGFGNVASNGYFQNENLNLANNHQMTGFDAFSTQQNSATVENMNFGGNFNNGNTAIHQNGINIQTNQRAYNTNPASQIFCQINICIDPNHSHEMSQFLLLPFCQRCGEIRALNSGVVISQQQAMAALRNYNINQQNYNRFNPTE